MEEIRRRASKEVCLQSKQKVEIDGWYAELLYGVNCSADISGTSRDYEIVGYSQAGSMFAIPDPKNKMRGYSIGMLLFNIVGDCADEVQIRRDTVPRHGYPFEETSTRYIYDSDIPPFTTTRRVTEVSRESLDENLFREPADYREVSFEKLYKHLTHFSK